MNPGKTPCPHLVAGLAGSPIHAIIKISTEFRPMHTWVEIA
jgi:hypothetical protein